MFDVNKNGRITADEIIKVFNDHNIAVSDIPRLIEIIDTNSDGTITFDEWFATLKPKRPCRSSDLEPIDQLSIEQKNLF